MAAYNQDAPARLVSGDAQPADDIALDRALRPRTLDDLIGQDKVRDNLRILIQAARARGEALDHILIYGPPGLGKTTLSHVIAHEMGANLRVTSGPAIERAGDLAAILTNLRKNDLLFIDEIHRLNRAVEEILYPAMEDYALDIVIGKGPGARSVRLKLPPITIVGATTRLALMTAPLRARFGATFRVDFYSLEAMEQIVARAARLMNTSIDPPAISEIARRARGTPRVGLRLFKRVRDYAQVKANGHISPALAVEALQLMEVDALGLDDLDRRVLRTIIEKFAGGPVGLETIAASISEEGDTIMDVVEPYLLQLGFLDRTPRGRVATQRAYEHLGLPYEPPRQPGLL
ncbi:MAG: Holliday junction branch migration DNA helicase RuvB [Anaerolineae bacterium]|nr:Holliday junction branch migration DNA helicase RuvB [Thermoflexales bacterium]MDW8406953.1 Holliday junction branch migration DNA helicase RuvB [Anaerolineae bacterium]